MICEGLLGGDGGRGCSRRRWWRRRRRWWGRGCWSGGLGSSFGRWRRITENREGKGRKENEHGEVKGHGAGKGHGVR